MLTSTVVRAEPARRVLLLAVVALVATALSHERACAASFNIAGPSGSVSFGLAAKALPNGNLVIVDPDGPTSGIGAVYLYTPAGSLISTMTGGTPNDHVGSGGVVVLPDGHFVVVSPHFTNGVATDAGAVTQIDGTAGLEGIVSADNSLVGSSPSDQVGYEGDARTAPYASAADGSVVVLDAQHYLILSPSWNNGGATLAGAVTFVAVAAPPIGALSASNSLVGQRTNDHVGGGGFGFLTNGNIVIASPDWNSAANAHVGAVTWMSGTAGFSGVVSAGNSLVGLNAMDQVGLYGIVSLANGNYVVDSPMWSNGATTSVGAVTWATGSARTAGLVTPANSVVGSTANDQIGDGGVTALTNSNFVIVSPDWNNVDVAATKAGAVTWCAGGAVCSETVSTANSLTGSKTGDAIGNAGVTALFNGNYVASSTAWANDVATNAGAATWLPGNAKTAEAVSDSNSLVGTQIDDQVGAGGLVALIDGAYVVDSYLWNNADVTEAGAITWGSGTVGISGPVTPDNSLVGSKTNDHVGNAGAFALGGGNYLVVSESWNNGALLLAGALTMGTAGTALTGPVTIANSLVGTQQDDLLGYRGVTVLANGDAVVNSPTWSNNTGAATLLHAGVAASGGISAANSLVGTTSGDSVGAFVTALGNGGYVVASPGWTDPSSATAHVGAVTLAYPGAALVGHVSSFNSLIGSAANDDLGAGIDLSSIHTIIFPIKPQDDNTFLVLSSPVNNGAGAVTLATGRFRLTGTLQTWNSIRGTLANEGIDMPYDYDPVRHRLVVGRPQENLVTVLDQEQIFADNFE